MKLRLGLLGKIAILSVALLSAMCRASFAQAPLSTRSLISLTEARAIVDGAITYARDQNMRMAVVVVDQSGHPVAADRMDGASFSLGLFAEGKAFASVILRQSTEAASALAKTRPDRFFGIMNMYPGKVYLVGGGLPLSVDNRVVGGVGVAGLPQGVDEKAATAGIVAWNKLRESMKK